MAKKKTRGTPGTAGLPKVLPVGKDLQIFIGLVGYGYQVDILNMTPPAKNGDAFHSMVCRDFGGTYKIPFIAEKITEAIFDTMDSLERLYLRPSDQVTADQYDRRRWYPRKRRGGSLYLIYCNGKPVSDWPVQQDCAKKLCEAHNKLLPDLTLEQIRAMFGRDDKTKGTP